ncbi:MAG: zinc metallopeptidase [Pirellulaceae bacterium]|nr:MAG: zinc metallopeptidase [Pirellulaceae bacterium]
MSLAEHGLGGILIRKPVEGHVTRQVLATKGTGKFAVGGAVAQFTVRTRDTTMWWDPQYIILVLLPSLVISGFASLLVQARFSRYSRVLARSGLTGAQAARAILDSAGLYDVQVEQTHGFLSDHYNPLSRTLALSPEVYHGRSLAAIGVAAHEAGHALQHAENYAPLWIRSALVPAAGIGSQLGWIVMAVGLMLHPFVVLLGAILFSGVLAFQLVTLPVEFDASHRAKQLVLQMGFVGPDEREGVDKVLNAAALTYVAALITSLLTLLYFLMRAGLLGGRDE